MTKFAILVYMKENIQIIRKNMKNIRLRVKPDGTVVLSAPHHVADAYLLTFLEEKSAWIQEQQRKIQQIQYKSGEHISLFGETYQLLVFRIENKKANITKNEHQIIMHIPTSYSHKQCEILLHRFYASQLQFYVPKMVKRYENVMDVSVDTIKYQHMQTRWGTCHIEKKLIRLNTRLSTFSLEVVESVVVHEMVHLLERGHNKRFYQLMDYFYPQWKICDKKLKLK